MMRKKLKMKILTGIIVSTSIVGTVADALYATEPIHNTKSTISEVDQYIDALYGIIDWKKNPLHKDAFKKAVIGYYNLKYQGLVDKDILTVADYTKSSNTNRLWVIDMKKRKVLFNTLVAHGANTGEEFATKFSNTQDSHQSSLGFYITADTYQGENGYSMKLIGKDVNYNSAAMDRAIVMHGADYVSKEFIAANQRLGRSWGCPAVKRELAAPIINTIKNGSVLYHYHQATNHATNSVWLKKGLKTLPMDYMEVMVAAKNKNPNDSESNLQIELPELSENAVYLTDSVVVDSSRKGYRLIRTYQRKVPVLMASEQ